MNKPVRTRFAPSPTGFLHIGGLRTALYAYAWAKKHGGTFILRIEDTDQARFVPGAVAQIIRSLKWAGITPDEGSVDEQDGKIINKGECGPYVQSERISLYTKFAQQLLAEKKAYKCYCTPERLEEMRTLQLAAKQMPKYDRRCLTLSDAERSELEQKGAPCALRFLVPEGPAVGWDDTVFGNVSFERVQIDDMVIMKADGFPTYNFANVVDDHTMQITHVIRGQEFLSSTPKHLLLYEAIGAQAPVYAHASHILGKDKKKLSKRQVAVSVDEYRKMGYLPQALINFIALLGWTHPQQQELFSLDELVKQFDIKDIHKAGAVFDIDKSLWMNGQYIRALSPEAFLQAAQPFLEEAGLNNLDKKIVQGILAIEQLRIKRLDEVAPAIRLYLDPVIYDPALLVWKKAVPEQIPAILADVRQALDKTPDDQWNAQGLQAILQRVVQINNRGVGDVFWPTRVALTGKAQSASPNEVAAVLGKAESLRRIDHALNLLKG
ncbi:MAG: glutamate--tRNA ligase [Parcubacteria group bacterium]|nr:glutamate--tRNA ligase [Parcubacteria group bacterium]